MENTHEVYVNLEIAEMLKKAGFNWKCHASYQNGEFTEFRYSSYFKVLIMDFNNAPDYMNQYSAPSLDVAQRWLREVKNYYVSVDVDCDSIGVFYTVRYVFHDGDKYNASYIWEDTGLSTVKHRRIFDNFEEAQEAGIKKALELILK